MLIHLCTRAAIEVRDLDRETSRFDQGIDDSIHANVFNLDLIWFNLRCAVLINAPIENKGLVTFWAGLHPGAGE